MIRARVRYRRKLVRTVVSKALFSAMDFNRKRDAGLYILNCHHLFDSFSLLPYTHSL